MKKLTKFAFSLALALALILALAVCAYADSSVPKEYVAYGYGMPEAAPVDMHDLLPENITVDGIALDIRCENGQMFLRLTDLAAAKLLRDSADKAAELGLDYSKLYISDGIILVREDGLTADEIADIQAKLSELTRSAEIKVSEGDTFDFSNGGETALIVEIGGFIMPPAPEDKAETEAARAKLDVKAAEMNANSLPERSSVSTVYISYFGVSQSEVEINDYSDAFNTYREGYVFLVKAEGDSNDYYISVSFGEGTSSPYTNTKMKDAGALSEGESMTEGEEAFSIVNVEPPEEIEADLLAVNETDGDAEEYNLQYKLAQTVTIATDSAGQNIVKTINLKAGIGDSIVLTDIQDSGDNLTVTINGEKEYAYNHVTGEAKPTGDNVDIEVSGLSEGAPVADSVVDAPEVDATVWDIIEVNSHPN